MWLQVEESTHVHPERQKKHPVQIIFKISCDVINLSVQQGAAQPVTTGPKLKTVHGG